MLNQTRIDKHKADIEQRIAELEIKLKQPNKGSQSLSLQISNNGDSQYRRNLVQRQQYVEPKQVTALRQRQLNIRPSQQAHQFYQSNNHNFNYKKRASSNSSCIEDERKRKRSPQEYKLSNLQGVNQCKKKNQTKELYDLMTEILNNQKNLQRQLGLLRLEWNKERTIKNSKGSSRLQEISHCQNNQETKSQVISFQDQQIVGQARAFEIVNKRDKISNENELREENQKLINRLIRSTKKRNENNYRNHENEQIQTFGAYKNENESNQSIDEQKRTNKQKTNNSKKVKKIQRIQRKQVQVQQKLFNLIKKQKTRAQRFRVKSQDKNQVWKKVEQRIKVSQSEYKQSIHRNNRYQHEHLVNTNQLQKKVREEIIVKIHNQSNNYLYK